MTVEDFAHTTAHQMVTKLDLSPKDKDKLQQIKHASEGKCINGVWSTLGKANPFAGPKDCTADAMAVMAAIAAKAEGNSKKKKKNHTGAGGGGASNKKCWYGAECTKSGCWFSHPKGHYVPAHVPKGPTAKQQGAKKAAADDASAADTEGKNLGYDDGAAYLEALDDPESIASIWAFKNLALEDGEYQLANKFSDKLRTLKCKKQAEEDKQAAADLLKAQLEQAEAVKTQLEQAEAMRGKQEILATLNDRIDQMQDRLNSTPSGSKLHTIRDQLFQLNTDLDCVDFLETGDGPLRHTWGILSGKVEGLHELADFQQMGWSQVTLDAPEPEPEPYPEQTKQLEYGVNAADIAAANMDCMVDAPEVVDFAFAQTLNFDWSELEEEQAFSAWSVGDRALYTRGCDGEHAAVTVNVTVVHVGAPLGIPSIIVRMPDGAERDTTPARLSPAAGELEPEPELEDGTIPAEPEPELEDGTIPAEPEPEPM